MISLENQPYYTSSVGITKLIEIWYVEIYESYGGENRSNYPFIIHV